MKVVRDTNVLISGIFFSGPPAEILKSWRDGTIQLALSPDIIDEYFDVAARLAGKFPSIEISPILSLIVTRSEITEPAPLSYQVCEDPDDDKFLACALASKSKTIISGDKGLLRVTGYQGIAVVTPRAFIEQYLKRQP